MAEPAKILVVDDEPDLEQLVAQRFRKQVREGKVRFLFAHDGVEALEVIESHPDVDMVVSDINMPRMDGLVLLEKLQAGDIKPSTVIVSAYGDMTNIRTAMNRGAFAFLTKPIDFGDLEATIERTIRHVGILREAHRRLVQAEKARLTLSRYFSPRLAERLLDDETDSNLAGHRCEIAAVFTDIERFTAMVETIEPSLLAKLLNDYLEAMTEVAFRHEGTIAKILGDALHVIFGVHAGPAIVGNFGGGRFLQ